MTISATNASNTLLGNGVTTAFPYTFAAFAEADVVAYVDGALQTDYIVTRSAGDEGGTVTFDVAPASGASVQIAANPDFTQDIAFTNSGPFLASTHDTALDRAATRDIYLKAMINRAGVPFGVDIAGLSPIFDEDGNLTAGLPPKGDPGSPGEGYPTRALMAAATPAPSNLDDAYLTEPGREGKFIFSTANLSAQVTADTLQGIYIAKAGGNGSTGAWVRTFDGPVKPEWFGALGNGTTDDTAALRGWVAYDAALHQLDRRKVYLVGATEVGGVILPLTDTRQIDLNGATIKIKNNSNEFRMIIGSEDPSDDLSFTSIYGGIFDYNKANNSYTIAATSLTHRLQTFRAANGTDIEFTDNIIIDAMTSNSVVLNGWQSGGSIQNIKRARVNRNTWLRVGGGATEFDHSTIYFHGDGLECFDNTCIGDSLLANGTKCFLEPHGTRVRIARNYVLNMQGFANVTGIYSGGDVEASYVSDNFAEVLQFGCRMFSLAYENHISGYGINGLVVQDNHFRIHQSQLGAGTDLVYIGVGFQSAATLPIKDVLIKGNTVIYDQEDSATAYTASAPALGSFETSGAATIVYENIVIDGNHVVNAPGPAAALGGGGGIFKNCAITRSNRFINPGQSLSPSLGTSVKTGIYLDGTEYQGTIEASGTVIDGFDTTRIGSGVYAAPTNSSLTCLLRSDLDIFLAGTVTSAFARPFRNVGALLAPLVHARMNKSASPTLSDQVGFKTGSSVEDTLNGVIYKVHIAGGGWVPQNHITVINSTSAATHTLTLTDFGNHRRYTNATGVTVTVPPTSSVAFPIGAKVDIEQAGAGFVTVAAGAGVTLVAQGGTLTTAAQYQRRTLTKVAADTWLLS